MTVALTLRDLHAVAVVVTVRVEAVEAEKVTVKERVAVLTGENEGAQTNAAQTADALTQSAEVAHAKP